MLGDSVGFGAGRGEGVENGGHPHHGRVKNEKSFNDQLFSEKKS
jgi:hypothetical protein